MAEPPSRVRFEQEALVHLPALLRYARYMTADVEDAKDLVQETYLEAWKSFDRYRAGTNCKAWLFRIFHNLWSKKRRSESRCAPPPLELDAMSNPDAVLSEAKRSPDAVDALEAGEIQQALQALAAEYREVLLLTMEGLSYRETAEVLSVPAGTVMSRIHRGRQALREQLRARGYHATG